MALIALIFRTNCTNRTIPIDFVITLGLHKLQLKIWAQPGGMRGLPGRLLNALHDAATSCKGLHDGHIEKTTIMQMFA